MYTREDFNKDVMNLTDDEWAERYHCNGYVFRPVAMCIFGWIICGAVYLAL